MKKVLKSFKEKVVHICKTLKNSLVDAFLHDQKKIAKYLICFSAVMHLLLSSVQIEAISKLTNQICGITMFLFVLFGFVCLFNAIRLKEPRGRKIVFSIIMLVLVIGTGVYLLTIYFDALMHQKDIMASPVISAVILSVVVLALYLFGLVETIVAYLCYHNKLKKEKEIANA